QPVRRTDDLLSLLGLPVALRPTSLTHGRCPRQRRFGAHACRSSIRCSRPPTRATDLGSDERGGVSGRIGQGVAWIIITCVRKWSSWTIIMGFQPAKIDDLKWGPADGLFHKTLDDVCPVGGQQMTATPIHVGEQRGVV